jgi:cob(I)alamin adenosyltransferase
VYLYAAATAAYRGQGKLAWRLYERMLRAAWAGRVDQVQAALNEQVTRLEPPPPQARGADTRKIVAQSLAYVQNNAGRMNYPQYRREGLPVTSAAVESLIKQFNQRVKGTEKFWLRGGAEAVLQVRAAYLSDDGRGEHFHHHRPRARAVGRNRLRLSA